MNDSDFIFWYVNKHYLFTGIGFKYKYLINENHINFDKFYNNILNSTGINKIGNKTLREFLFKWYNTKISEAKLDILDYIKYKYKVTLGPTNWVIAKMSGEIIKKSDIAIDLNKKYDSKLITNLSEQWFDGELIRITENSTLHFK